MISALNAFFNPYPNMTGDSPTDEKLPQYDYTKAAKNDDDGEFCCKQLCIMPLVSYAFYFAVNDQGEFTFWFHLDRSKT